MNYGRILVQNTERNCTDGTSPTSRHNSVCLNNNNNKREFCGFLDSVDTENDFYIITVAKCQPITENLRDLKCCIWPVVVRIPYR